MSRMSQLHVASASAAACLLPLQCHFYQLLALGVVVVCSFCIVGLHHSDSGHSHAFPFSTPDCSRVLVYRFDSRDGFGSEFNTYLRAAALSSYLDYAVVPDTRSWIYGDLREFFLPPRLGCVLPSHTLDRWALPVGVPGWRLFSRVSLSRALRRHALLDRIVRAAAVDLRSMRALRAREALYATDEKRVRLPYGESVPDGVRRAFSDQVDTAERIWRPNARVQADMDSVRDLLRLRNATRARPIIAYGSGTRSGNKGTSAKPAPISHSVTCVYLDATREAATRLYNPMLSAHPFPLPTPKDTTTRPLLVVMTAEAGVLEALSALDVRGEFEIIASPAAQLFSPSERAEHAHLFSNASWRQETLSGASREMRLAIMRSLIVELTVYSRHANAFVVSGNCNLGRRLALVFSGEEGALGPPVLREFGGRVRSIDVPYYPTAFCRYSFP